MTHIREYGIGVLIVLFLAAGFAAMLEAAPTTRPYDAEAIEAALERGDL
ncbi:hypothetical protein [Rhodovibrio sodomensis]|nr:hypothetical protein [Rhodovibrio sodomensis]